MERKAQSTTSASNRSPRCCHSYSYAIFSIVARSDTISAIEATERSPSFLSAGFVTSTNARLDGKLQADQLARAESAVPAIEVQTLLGERDINTGLRCLRSLSDCTIAPTRIVVHDDGTLSKASMDRLSEAVPSIEVIQRTDADEIAAEMLRSHPRCFRFRKSNVFGLKLFDVMFPRFGDIIRYVDSDVFFFRRFRGLFEIPERKDAVFLKDNQCQISIRGIRAVLHRLNFVGFLNAGLSTVRRAIFDLDRLEHLFSIPSSPVLRHFAEQTAWAFLCNSLRTVFWSTDQIRLADANTVRTPETVAIHYVSTYRSQLDCVNSSTTALPVVDNFVLEPATNINGFTILRNEVTRKVRRIIGTSSHS